MKIFKQFSTNRVMRLAVVVLMVVALFGVASFSLLAETSLKVSTVELPGADGAVNNPLFVFNRYVIVAPFAPTTDPDEDAGLSEYDNHFIHLIDTKKPEREKLSVDLQSCYYPTKIVYDEASSRVFVKGTEYIPVGEGEYEPVDVISHLNLNLDDNGKPIFGSTVATLRIPGRDRLYSNDAPNEFAIARRGQYLIFSNGASIFTYDTIQGFLQEANFVPIEDYGPNNRISFFDVDEASNTLTVAVNRKEEVEKDVWKYSSRIQFFKLNEDGTATLFKEMSEFSFPEGAVLPAGSNIIISSGKDAGSPEYAYFVTSDGSLYQVDLRDGEIFATFKIMEQFPDLAQPEPEKATPRIVQYDSSQRLIVIVKSGYVLQIAKPANGRRGRIAKPANLRQAPELPALILASMNKKSTKLTSSKAYTKDFEKTGGLSNFILNEDSRGFIAAFRGQLFSLDMPQDLSQAKMAMVGEIGSRVDRIEYNSSRSTLVAIDSLNMDIETLERTAPGSLVVAKLQDGNEQVSSLIEAFTSSRPFLAGLIPTIRRPCNIRR